MSQIEPTSGDVLRSDITAIPKVATLIQGVDDILHGGIPKGRTTLVGGGPGTGKTLVALEQLYHGARGGEPGIFVTFEERADAVRRNALSLGWDLEALERENMLLVMHAAVPVDVVQTGEFDLDGLLAVLDGQIAFLKAQRIVIDAADVLLRLFRDPFVREDQLFVLHNWLVEKGLTAVLTVKTHASDAAALHQLEYMTDCVLRLDQRVTGQLATRRMRVVKYRGSGFQSNEFPYVISGHGIVLMPVSNAGLLQQPMGPKFPSGIAALDPLLGGGFDQGSCILFGGASGTGKTTFACSLSAAAAARGERVLYITFEESVAGLVTTMRSTGTDLSASIDAGGLEILGAMPEAMGVEEHLWRIYSAIDSHNPRHVIVDAISACQRLGSEATAFDFLVRMLTYCKQRGVTCIYLNQTDPEHSIQYISGVGISSMVDALLVMEQDWPDDVHRRRLLIVKFRGARHSHLPHIFHITDDGIEIDPAPKMWRDPPEASS